MPRGFDYRHRPSSGLHVVEWGEAKIACGEAVLDTYGLESCIGVALYDSVSRLGYLAHSYANFDSYLETIVPVAKMATQLAGGGQSLQAWARGGMLRLESSTRSQQKAMRRDVGQLLAGLGIPKGKLDVQWNDWSPAVVNMRLLCQNGELLDTDGLPVPGRQEQLERNQAELDSLAAVPVGLPA